MKSGYNEILEIIDAKKWIQPFLTLEISWPSSPKKEKRNNKPEDIFSNSKICYNEG